MKIDFTDTLATYSEEYEFYKGTYVRSAMVSAMQETLFIECKFRLGAEPQLFIESCSLNGEPFELTLKNEEALLQDCLQYL